MKAFLRKNNSLTSLQKIFHISFHKNIIGYFSGRNNIIPLDCLLISKYSSNWIYEGQQNYPLMVVNNLSEHFFLNENVP